MKVVSAQEIMLDGNYPAYACVATTYRVSNSGKTYQQVICNLWYPRGNNTVFYLNYYMYSGIGIRYEDATLPTVEDFMPLLSQVSYSMPENREGIQDWLITKDDLEMSRSAKPDQYLLNAGGSMRFSVEYRNPALIKKMKNLQKSAWLVVDPEAMANGQVLTIDPSIATLDQNGNLKAGNVQEPVEVQVIAFSSNASTIQSRIVTLLPKMNKISVNEANVTMYVGDSMKLTGVFEPANAFWYSEKNGGNTAWSVDNKNAISLEDLKDGTAVVQALAAGKASVTLKDILSGKQARSNIQVLAPVEEVTVTGPDTVSPGKRAAYKAVIAPQNAGNKKVSWMVDVDESVATIDKNGNLAVNKAAEAGTSITITCTAEGAAVEVSAAKTITVQ